MSEESEKPNESQQLDDPKEPKQPDDKPKVNVLFGSTFTLFKRKLAVVCEKVGDKGYSFLLIPTKMDTDFQGITFKEMTDEIGNLFGQETINMDQLNKALTNDQKNDVTFNLNMAYFYFESTIENNTEKRKNVEFAFQVTVKGINNLIPEGFRNIIDIDNIQLAIWSTNRQKIIDAMHLISPKQFIDKQE